MIASMTAFARAQSDQPWGTLILEVRSVNHRYLDVSFKLPESLRVLENSWRETIRKQLGRGKTEFQLRLQTQIQEQQDLTINQALLKQVLQAAESVQENLAQDSQINPLELLRWPGILSEPEIPGEALQAAAHTLLADCLSILIENRQREGNNLSTAIETRLQGIDAIVTDTRSRLPKILEQQRTRLLSRLDELDVEADSHRLEQEVVYIAQKADVDEELDRLDTHLTEVRRTLKKGGPCGRRLDFLMQELNREANTLSSKSISTDTTQNAVELKVLIEQMREQIQNIE